MLGRKSEMRDTRSGRCAAVEADALGAADDGAAELGAADDGAAELGAADEGAADEGAADEGAAEDGAADAGADEAGAAVGAVVGAVVGAALAAVVGAGVAGVDEHADAIRTTALATDKSRARIQKPSSMRRPTARGGGARMVKARCATVNDFSAWL